RRGWKDARRAGLPAGLWRVPARPPVGEPRRPAAGPRPQAQRVHANWCGKARSACCRQRPWADPATPASPGQVRAPPAPPMQTAALGRPFASSLQRRSAVRTRSQVFLDARLLALQTTQVIQLALADLAVALVGDRV